MLKQEKRNSSRSWKSRYNGADKKRRWEENTRNDGETADKQFKPEDRIKRRKYVLLMGYSGASYFGMQRNPEMKTIEEELLKAMQKNNWINEEGFSRPQQIHFQRAARTDKGVSAARQCCSMKLRKSFLDATPFER